MLSPREDTSKTDKALQLPIQGLDFGNMPIAHLH